MKRRLILTAILSAMDRFAIAPVCMADLASMDDDALAIHLASWRRSIRKVWGV